jgi:hypothetical protein
MELEASAGKPITSPAARDVRLCGLKVLVDRQKAAGIDCEPGVLQPQAIGVADPACGHHDGVRRELAPAVERKHERRSPAHLVHPGCRQQVDTGLDQALLQEGRDLGVEKGHERPVGIDHGDRAAEQGHDGGVFAADRTGAHDSEGLWHAVRTHEAVGIVDPVAIEIELRRVVRA